MKQYIINFTGSDDFIEPTTKVKSTTTVGTTGKILLRGLDCRGHF